MKKKYLNLLIIFVLTLVVGIGEAKAYSVSREIKYFWNDYGIPNLYYKKIDGKEAFCSYFKKDAPASGGNGNLSLGSDEYLSETDKIGIAAIINSSASEVGVSDKYALYAAKELAINLYLSTKTFSFWNDKSNSRELSYGFISPLVIEYQFCQIE